MEVFPGNSVIIQFIVSSVLNCGIIVFHGDSQLTRIISQCWGSPDHLCAALIAELGIIDIRIAAIAIGINGKVMRGTQCPHVSSHAHELQGSSYRE